MNVEIEQIVKPLIKWFQKEKRDLPWRKTNDSYQIWISEIMLQQTRVEAVKEYYKQFLKVVPTLQDLAAIEEDQLLKLWEGLGYYSRARNLQKCAKYLFLQGKKELPRDYEELKKLPGIGPYAAASIGSIAYQLKTPAIDGNVLRVMTRIYEDDRDIMNKKVRDDYFFKLSKIMPENTRDFTEGLMELGALICLPNGNPLCDSCPLSFLCKSFKNKTMLNYPVKKKLEKRKIEEKTILILEYHDKIAIQKRPNKGLLASLYEFYSLEEKYSINQLKKYLKQIKIDYVNIELLKETKHIFSHLEWHMVGYYIHCASVPENSFIWVTKEELETKYSLPTAISIYANNIKK